MNNIINKNYIFHTEKCGYYKVDGVFYQVHLQDKTASKISFESMFYEYLIDKKSFLFRSLVLTYIKLCCKLFNIRFEFVNNKTDLNDLEDMMFRQGQLLTKE